MSESRRAWGKILRRTLAVLVGLAILGALVFAWLPKPVLVEVGQARRGSLTVTVDEDGRTRVKDRYTVSAPLSGNLARIELRPGDTVEQGQVLARIVPSSAPLLDARSREEAEARVAAAEAARRQSDAQMERARAALDFASKDAARQRELLAHSVIPREALDRALLDERVRKAELTSAEFGGKIAEYELRMARATLGHHHAGAAPGREDQMELPSPVAGRVLRVLQESEGAVPAGAPLIEIGDPAALEIAIDVLTSDAVHIAPGATVSLERWGGELLHGRVRLIEPSAFTRLSALGVEEQRVNAIIDLDEPYEKWAALGDGYRVEARITIWQEPSVLKVPASALFRHGDGWAVFQVTDTGRASLCPVRVGRQNGESAQILGGLPENARVVVHPSDRVADGVRLTHR